MLHDKDSTDNYKYENLSQHAVTQFIREGIRAILKANQGVLSCHVKEKELNELVSLLAGAAASAEAQKKMLQVSTCTWVFGCG